MAETKDTKSGLGALSVAVIAVLPLALFALARGLWGTIEDFDELWHLATGRFIVEHLSVPMLDPFTHTAKDTPWVNTNWLAQVILWGLYRVGGIELDWLLGFAILLGSTALAHLTARRAASSAWAALPATYFVFLSLLTGSMVRPQGWTILLLALALWVLRRFRERLRWGDAVGLGCCLALAAQLHGGYCFVFLAVGLSLVAELWDLARGAPGAGAAQAAARAAALALGVAGALLHPHGVDALLYPLSYVSAELREMAQLTVDVRPPDFSTWEGGVVELSVLALLFLVVVRRPAWRSEDLLLTLVFAHFAFRHSRGLHLFAVAVAGPLALAVDGALRVERAPRPVRALLAAAERSEPEARTLVSLVPLVLALVFLLVLIADAQRLRQGVPGDLSSPRLSPHADVAEVADLLARKDPPGAIFNEFEHGGVLIWRLYPRRVFVDSRGDLHARAGTFHECLTAINALPGWDAILQRHGCTLAVLDKGPPSPLRDALERAGWRVAFENRSTALLVGPGTAAEATLLGR